MMEIIREYKVTAKEFVIKTNLGDTVCICGNHINGAYLAIPSYGMSVELADDGNIEDNTDRIQIAFDDVRNKQCNYIIATRDVSRNIAEAINPYITTEQTVEEYFKSIMGEEGNNNVRVL